jgi:hypothetical protein
LLCSATPAGAQPIGTFRWQLLPYCNVLTLNVTRQNSVYTLDGTEDRCGAAQAASAVGVAFLHADGTVGFGVTTVLPAGTPVHLEAAISLSSLGGTWRDSAGNSGTLVFIQGTSIGGVPRPIPSGGVPLGSITGAHLAAGTVGATELATNSVSGESVIDGSLTHADMADAPFLSVDSSPDDSIALPPGASTVVLRVAVNAPVKGRVLVTTSGVFNFASNATVDSAACSLTTATLVGIPFAVIAQEWTAASYRFLPFGGSRTFNVAGGSSTTFRLVCAVGNNSADVSVLTPVLNALFIAGFVAP